MPGTNLLRVPVATSPAPRSSGSSMAGSCSSPAGPTARSAGSVPPLVSFRSSDRLLLEFLSLLISFLLILEFAGKIRGYPQRVGSPDFFYIKNYFSLLATLLSKKTNLR